MKKVNKKIFIPVLALVLIALTSYGYVSSAQAEDVSSLPPVIESLVEKFDLDEEEVQDALDEVRADHHAQMQMHFEEKLQEAVDNGNLTQEQMQLILDKHEEMMAERTTHHEEMEAWAEENGIDMGDLFGGGMHHQGRGPHML